MFQRVDYATEKKLHTDYIRVFDSIYTLEALTEEEIENIFLDIKKVLIETYNIYPSTILTDISIVSIYRNRYLNEYWKLFLKIYNEYKPKLSKDISIIFQYYIYKYLNIICDKSLEEKIKIYVSTHKSLEPHQDNPLLQAIMTDNVKELKELLKEKKDYNQKFRSEFFPNPDHECTLIELCAYYNAVGCFLALNSLDYFKFSQEFLEFAFLHQCSTIIDIGLSIIELNEGCMKYAIISHKFDYVYKYMNYKPLPINLDDCFSFNNLLLFLNIGDKLYKLEKSTGNIYKINDKIYPLDKRTTRLVFKKIYYLGKKSLNCDNTSNLTEISERSIYFSKFQTPINQKSIKINDKEHQMRPSTIELINELEPSDNWLFFDSNNSEYIKFILELISVKQFREILQPKAIKGYFQRSFAELLFKYNYLSQTDVKTCGNAWIQFLLDVYEGESLYSMNENQNKISKLLIRNAMENFLHICKNLALFGPYTCILYIWNEKICQNSEEEKSKLNYFPISIPFIPENHLAVDPNNLDPIVDLFEQGYKDILIYAYLSEFHTIFVNFLDEFPTVDDFHKDYTEIIPKIKTRLISHDYSDQALSNFIDFFVRYFPDNELGISPQVEEDVSNKTGIDIKFFKKMNPNYNLEEEELEEKRNKDEFVEMFSDARFPLNEYYRQNVGYTFKTNLNFKVDDEPPDFG